MHRRASIGSTVRSCSVYPRISAVLDRMMRRITRLVSCKGDELTYPCTVLEQSCRATRWTRVTFCVWKPNARRSLIVPVQYVTVWSKLCTVGVLYSYVRHGPAATPSSYEYCTAGFRYTFCMWRSVTQGRLSSDTEAVDASYSQ